ASGRRRRQPATARPFRCSCRLSRCRSARWQSTPRPIDSTGLQRSAMLPRLRAALAGRYTIELELGQGGMATVYLAQDVRHDRRVAVKVLRPELSLELGADRFVREIHLSARLLHKTILSLVDSGVAGEFLYS